jgi:hypothetical protein
MRHPAYVNSSQYWEAMGKFDNSNLITDQFIMFGVSQVNDDEITDEMINKIDDFMSLW